MSRYFVHKKTEFQVSDPGTLSACLEFVEGALKETGLNRKTITQGVLLAEESLADVLENAKEDAKLEVEVKRYIGNTSVTFCAKGEEYDPFHMEEIRNERLENLEENESQMAIRSIFLRSKRENFRYSYKNGRNNVRLSINTEPKSSVLATVIALVAGVLFGLLMKMLIPSDVAAGISQYALNPIKTMFMNALRIVIAPVVFFSIVSCVSQFKDLAELGRIGVKVMGMYILTTIIAVILALVVSGILRPGEWGFAIGMTTESVDVNLNVDTSLLTTIINIVPANFIRPFLESDTLQLIFLAVLCGAAVGMIGDYSIRLKELFDALNSLFLTITTLIAGLIPIAVFCSVSLMFFEMGGESLIYVLGMGLTQITTIIIMIGVYGLLILILARLNPLKFYQKNRTGMITGFTLCSSAAAMPVNIKNCTDRLGVSPKVCNFSIPLGATVNMDGTCIYLVCACLFLARAYGVAVQPEALVSFAITVILLSLGAPGVPGSALVCMGVALAVLGVPVEAIGITLAINPFLDMFDTMCNTTGDVACAVIVSKSEGLLDVKKYNSKERKN